jgi:transcriptional regulator with XRE-family HTH domain
MKNKPYNEFDSFAGLFEQAEQRLDYNVEGAKNDFTEQLVNRMEAIEMTRAELAERLGKKKPQITRFLRGNNNFTLETMVEIADAMDCTLTTTLKPKESKVIWLKDLCSKLTPGDNTWALNDQTETNEDELETEYGNFAATA